MRKLLIRNYPNPFNIMCLILFMIISSPASGQIAQGGETQAHDITVQLVQTDLTHDGIQYSPGDTTTTADTYITIFEKSFDMGLSEHWSTGINYTQTMIDCYFKIIVASAGRTSGTADIKWIPQVRNKDGTWFSLCDSINVQNPGTTLIDSLRKGYAELPANFNTVPFDFRVIMNCNEVNEGISKVKSGSYIRAIYKEKQ